MGNRSEIEGCKWCNPDENGQYSANQFANPNGSQKILMFFNGAHVTLSLEEAGRETAHMVAPINYCPVCGRRVRLEATE